MWCRLVKWTQTPIQTLRQDPVSASIKSHILLLRGGYVQQLSAGLFTYAPFMVRSIQKFSALIRKILNKKGLVEIYMPMVQPKEIWEKTGRWSDFSEILQKVKNRSGQEFCLGPTHEEVVSEYVRNQIKSYRDLPCNVYQMQTKYRDEFRPRFGLLRAREFSMKDAYSFDLNKEEALKSFQKMENIYHDIFSKLDVKFCVVQADSGLIGGDHSKEFHILAEQGEDRLFISEDRKWAFNHEIQEKQNIKGKMKEYRGIEVGHIFYLGKKYSQAMDVSYLDKDGNKQWVEMGCYGIGISRTLQAVIEQSHDELGMIWPFSIAPFTVHLVSLNMRASNKIQIQTEKIYKSLWSRNIDCFLDDRDQSAGVKFKDADLLGLPLRITVGERDLNQNQVEAVFRKTGEKSKWNIDDMIQNIEQAIPTNHSTQGVID